MKEYLATFWSKTYNELSFFPRMQTTYLDSCETLQIDRLWLIKIYAPYIFLSFRNVPHTLLARESSCHKMKKWWIWLLQMISRFSWATFMKIFNAPLSLGSSHLTTFEGIVSVDIIRIWQKFSKSDWLSDQS